VGRNDLGKSLQSNDSVRVIKLSARKVVSIGIRGGYSEEKFRKNKSALNAWLSENDQYEKMGSAYGVYWNGPFMPGFFKRSEVHIPIRKKNQSNKSNKSKNK
jgi:DNA gyrase inhibitor GyrI